MAVPIAFLGGGRFRATVYGDDLGSEHRVAERAQEVGARDTLRVSLARAGGALIRLAPREVKPAGGRERVRDSCRRPAVSGGFPSGCVRSMRRSM